MLHEQNARPIDLFDYPTTLLSSFRMMYYNMTQPCLSYLSRCAFKDGALHHTSIWLPFLPSGTKGMRTRSQLARRMISSIYSTQAWKDNLASRTFHISKIPFIGEAACFHISKLVCRQQRTILLRNLQTSQRSFACEIKDEQSLFFTSFCRSWKKDDVHYVNCYPKTNRDRHGHVVLQTSQKCEQLFIFSSSSTRMHSTKLPVYSLDWCITKWSPKGSLVIPFAFTKSSLG